MGHVVALDDASCVHEGSCIKRYAYLYPAVLFILLSIYTRIGEIPTLEHQLFIQRSQSTFIDEGQACVPCS